MRLARRVLSASRLACAQAMPASSSHCCTNQRCCFGQALASMKAAVVTALMRKGNRTSPLVRLQQKTQKHIDCKRSRKTSGQQVYVTICRVITCGA